MVPGEGPGPAQNESTSANSSELKVSDAREETSLRGRDGQGVLHDHDPPNVVAAAAPARSLAGHRNACGAGDDVAAKRDGIETAGRADEGPALESCALTPQRSRPLRGQGIQRARTPAEHIYIGPERCMALHAVETPTAITARRGRLRQCGAVSLGASPSITVASDLPGRFRELDSTRNRVAMPSGSAAFGGSRGRADRVVRRGRHRDPHDAPRPLSRRGQPGVCHPWLGRDPDPKGVTGREPRQGARHGNLPAGPRQPAPTRQSRRRPSLGAPDPDGVNLERGEEPCCPTARIAVSHSPIVHACAPLLISRAPSHR